MKKLSTCVETPQLFDGHPADSLRGEMEMICKPWVGDRRGCHLVMLFHATRSAELHEDMALWSRFAPGDLG
ncbi:hypothetical protein C2W62_02145 [Candidatus Entotheonella serta]|nr:hypothetical protein C2W62_02145 [Candidatus Entotheonella serta]